MTAHSFTDVTALDEFSAPSASSPLPPAFTVWLHALATGVSFAQTFIIPAAALEKIGDKNQLVLQKLTFLYHHHFPDEFVRIISSEQISLRSGRCEIMPWGTIITGIKGESNLAETLIELGNQCREPILMQASPQPLSSGIAFSLHPQTKDKTTVMIQSQWGVYQETAPFDTFLVDTRTLAVRETIIATKEHLYQQDIDAVNRVEVPPKLQTAASLSPEQLSQLASMVIRVKRTTLEQVKVTWMVVGTDIYLTWVEVLPEAEILAGNNQTVSADSILCQGTGLIAGMVSGPALLISNHAANSDHAAHTTTVDHAANLTHTIKSTIAQHRLTNPILVTKTLTQAQLPLLKIASGVVCDGSIADQSVLAYLRRHGLPTIINAHHGCVRIRPGKLISIDGDKGTVASTDQKSSPVATETESFFSTPFFRLPDGKLVDDKSTQKPLSLDQSGLHALLTEERFLLSELTALERYLKSHPQSASLLLPLVRSVDEVYEFSTLIHHKFPVLSQSVTIWVELILPLALDHAESFVRPLVAGAVINPQATINIKAGGENIAITRTDWQLIFQQVSPLLVAHMPIILEVVHAVGESGSDVLNSANPINANPQLLEDALHLGISGRTMPKRFDTIATQVSNEERNLTYG